MGSREPGHDAWAGLDGTSDPSYFVRFLDASRRDSLEGARADPERFFADWQLRAGNSVLSVGCGTGDLELLFARLVSPGGRVVGIDLSETMVREAQRRAEGTGLPVEFRRGDAHTVDFPDGSFDRATASAVLQHLRDPDQALREIVRVTRAGGRVVISEHDWGTAALDSDDRSLTRRLLDFFTDSIPQGWIGRRLPGMFREAGLVDVAAKATFLRVPPAGIPWTLADCVRRAMGAGIVTSEEGSRWLADQEARGRDGRFFYGFVVIRVSGQKP